MSLVLHAWSEMKAEEEQGGERQDADGGLTMEALCPPLLLLLHVSLYLLYHLSLSAFSSPVHYSLQLSSALPLSSRPLLLHLFSVLWFPAELYGETGPRGSDGARLPGVSAMQKSKPALKPFFFF